MNDEKNWCESVPFKERKLCLKKHLQLDELLNNAKGTIHEMLDRSYSTGALTEEMKEDNYLLPKAIVTIWSEKGEYAPVDKKRKKDVSNLSHFI